MTERRGKGEDSIYFEHAGACRDATRHRNCPGRWRGVISAGFTPDSKRLRRYASAPPRAAVTDKLRQLQAEVTAGAKPAPSNHTVRAAAEDWLENGLPAGPRKPSVRAAASIP